MRPRKTEKSGSGDLFRARLDQIINIRHELVRLTGREIERGYLDKGYRGHDAPKQRRVFRSGQKRGVHGQIKKELRRRASKTRPRGRW